MFNLRHNNLKEGEPKMFEKIENPDVNLDVEGQDCSKSCSKWAWTRLGASGPSSNCYEEVHYPGGIFGWW